MRLPTLLVLLWAGPSMAKMVQRPVPYEIAGAAYEGVLIYDDAVTASRPGLVLVPNWLGITPANLSQAEGVAGQRYVVFVVDMFGKKGRPKNSEEAGKKVGVLKADRRAMRERAKKALDQLLRAKAPVDPARLGALGFCFGGTAALELARTGAKLAGVVSFHGGLSSPTPEDARGITAKVLALHGADDPTVSPDEVRAFEAEMRGAKVDWQLVSFGGAVHSFTDPDAKMTGVAEYNPTVAKRAYAMMNDFFAEAFAP